MAAWTGRGPSRSGGGCGAGLPPDIACAPGELQRAGAFPLHAGLAFEGGSGEGARPPSPTGGLWDYSVAGRLLTGTERCLRRAAAGLPPASREAAAAGLGKGERDVSGID